MAETIVERPGESEPFAGKGGFLRSITLKTPPTTQRRFGLAVPWRIVPRAGCLESGADGAEHGADLAFQGCQAGHQNDGDQ